MTALVSSRALVVAPHADDEVLGVGGTIARLATRGWHVSVLVVTKPMAPRFPLELAERIRGEALAAHEILGVADTRFLEGFPAAGLDTQSESVLNDAMSAQVAAIRPDWVFAPHPGDMHFDHRFVFNAIMVACRPIGPAYPRRIFAYETLSETNWNAPYASTPFLPNTYVDISLHLEAKLRAMSAFASQIKTSPNERSLEGIQSLATMRGATAHMVAAEAFVSVREVLDPT